MCRNRICNGSITVHVLLAKVRMYLSLEHIMLLPSTADDVPKYIIDDIRVELCNTLT